MGAQPTRRDFLQCKAAADALADALVRDDAQDATAAPAESYELRLARRAMACQFEFRFNAGQNPHATQLGMLALDLVDQLEDQLTVYREHSEVSRLNARAAAGPVAVEPRLFALLEQALVIHRETAGAYDITAAALSKVWGFTRRRGAIPTEADLAIARAVVGSQFVTIDPSAGTVEFNQTGVAINLGSIGKGYALDRCAELLEAGQVHDFVLHGGHSSVLARGDQWCNGAGGGWLIGVRDPLRPERRLGQLRLCNGGLATSGSGTQFFLHAGKRYGHILDPRTGWPADGVLSVSVLAATAARADALSTAFYVLGPAGAQAYCERHDQVGCVMLCPGGRSGSVERHVFGTAVDCWQAADGATT